MNNEVFRQSIVTPIEESVECFDETTNEYKPTKHDEKVMDFLSSIIEEGYTPLDLKEVENTSNFVTVILYNKTTDSKKPSLNV